MKTNLSRIPACECRACGKMTSVPLSHLCPWEMMPRSFLHERGFPVNGRSIHRRSGSEGCRNDPYAWEEFEVSTATESVSFRAGALGYVRLTVKRPGQRWPEVQEVCPRTPHDQNLLDVLRTFKAMTNIHPDDIERIYWRLHRDDQPDPMGDPRSYR